ncbi:putative 53 exonuclease and flap-endonuclease [Phaeomoniella chlamydospora]|uniref:Putative 53 exonuclease and flap-endonuclease n=1 Tax=Phaeomoniella chlamydospora TaxID=158046 RepID=A0A0G2EZ62_PHACM|nr:putative 53 exonuclease and flap-endonuclease [Phaeomoniella chlamydospora]
MGIQGLLPLIKSIHKPGHLKKYAGQTLGVDAYGWLHRGVIACAVDLALGKPTRKHIHYVLHRVRMLLHFGVKPYLVFDGDHLPSKAQTEAARRAKREDAKKEGLELFNAGKTAQAYKVFQKAIDVTPQMTHALIQELKKLDVAYVVAPYEADAQLAYLERKGLINGVLSEDSDLLVFGVQKLLTKLDQYGNFVEVNRNEFTACRDISLIGWTDADFRRMAILSGCDYLNSLPNMGLKTAYRYVRKYKAIERVLKMLQFDGGMFIPPEYAANFEQAERTFIHHRVFCPLAKELVFLTDLPDGMKEEDMPYLGPKVDDQTAVLVAVGELDPMTKTPITLSGKSTMEMSPSLKTPIIGENRRHTFGTTEELKDNKKVTTFFKKRTPLAELDPNSLTPSPSQHRLLQRHSNASWTASPSPSPAVHPAQSSGREVRVHPETEAVLRRASRLSDCQPPKRQRLCSDLDNQSMHTENLSSPFFATTANATPGKAFGKTKKAKRATFGVFSDELVDDILAQMPEATVTDGIASKDGTDVGFTSNEDVEQLKDSPAHAVIEPHATATHHCHIPAEDKLPVNENVDIVPASSPPPCESVDQMSGHSTQSFSTLSKSQASRSGSQSTAATSTTHNGSFVDLLEHHVDAQTADFFGRFSYQAETTTTSFLRDTANPVDSANEADNTPPGIAEATEQSVEEKIQVCQAAVEHRASSQPSRPLTPLQRLSHTALHKAKSFNLINAHGIGTPFQQRMSMDDSNVDSNRRVIGFGNRDLVEDKGSEDLIVPKSDDEDDDLPEHRPALDLGRFAFKAS